MDDNGNEELTYDDVVQYCSNHEEAMDRPKQLRQTDKRGTCNGQQKKKEPYNKRSNQRISVELQEARKQFTQIAESHARALQLFADASMKQADAAMILTETERARNALEEKRIFLEEKKLHVDENLIKILDHLHTLIEKVLFT